MSSIRDRRKIMSEEVKNLDMNLQPMVEDFENEELNCYNVGPGANIDNHLQVGVKNKNAVTLFIGHLPTTLSQDGLLGLFRTSAKPINIRMHGNYAFAEFSSLREADLVIQDLHEKPPYHLRVMFSRSKEDKNKLKRDKELLKAVKEEGQMEFESHPFRKTVPFKLSVGRGTIGRGIHRIKSERNPGELDDDKDLSIWYYKQESGVLTSHSGRHVYMGRGYNKFDCEDPFVGMSHGKNFTMLSYGKEDEILVEDGLDIIHSERQLYIGVCKVCRKKTTFICSKCSSTYYCSDYCRDSDWDEHRIICSISNRKTPSGAIVNGNSPFEFNGYRGVERNYSLELEKRIRSRNVEQVSDMPWSRFSKESTNPTSPPQHAFRTQDFVDRNEARGNSDEQRSNLSGKVSRDNFHNRQKFTNNNTTNVDSDLLSLRGGRNTNQRFQKPRESRKNGYRSSEDDGDRQQRKQLPGQNFQKDRGGDGQTIELDKPTFKQETFAQRKDNSHKMQEKKKVTNKQKFDYLNLNSTNNTGVTVIYPDPDQIKLWVTKLSDVENYRSIYSELQQVGPSAKLCDIVNIGDLYVTLFEDTWYRVKVVAKIGQKYKVHFIDFGNFDECEDNDLKILKENLKTQPGLVFPVRLPDGTIDKYANEDSLLLRAIGRDEDDENFTYIVKVVENQSDNMTSSSHKYIVPSQLKIKLPALFNYKWSIDKLKVDTEGNIILSRYENKVYNACVVSNEEQDNVDLVHMINVSARQPINAVKGDIVLTDNGIRALVLSNNNNKSYTVGLLDSAKIQQHTTVYPIEEKEKNIPFMGAKLTLQRVVGDDMFKNCSEDILAFFKVVKEIDEYTVKVELLDEIESRTIGWGLIEKWIPHVNLTNKTDVVLTYFDNVKRVSLSKNDDETKEALAKLSNELASVCANSEALDRAPEVGEIICAKFKEDNCYYRAKVSQVRPADNPVEALVFFVDFGNKQICSVKELKPLPPLLKIVPYFAAHVNLLNVPSGSDISNAETVVEYMNNLVAADANLVVEFEGDVNDGVVLYEKDSKKNINDHLISILEPDFEKVLQDHAKSLEDSKELTGESGKISEDVPQALGQELFRSDSVPEIKMDVGKVDNLCLLYCNEKCLQDGLVFCCQFDNTYKNVAVAVHKQIQTYCSEIPAYPYKPVEDEVCLAVYDGAWYRALCVQVLIDSCELFFLDYGNMEVTKTENIRKIIKTFTNPPALASMCVLKGHDKLKENKVLLEKVNSTLESVLLKPLSAEVSQTREGSYMVDIDVLRPLLQ